MKEKKKRTGKNKEKKEKKKKENIKKNEEEEGNGKTDEGKKIKKKAARLSDWSTPERRQSYIRYIISILRESDHQRHELAKKKNPGKNFSMICTIIPNIYKGDTNVDIFSPLIISIVLSLTSRNMKICT